MAETLTRKDAATLTARSRSYGWFRADDYLTGWRSCLNCRTRITGTAAYGKRGDQLAAAINDAIDDAMVAHLLDGCRG